MLINVCLTAGFCVNSVNNILPLLRSHVHKPLVRSIVCGSTCAARGDARCHGSAQPCGPSPDAAPSCWSARRLTAARCTSLRPFCHDGPTAAVVKNGLLSCLRRSGLLVPRRLTLAPWVAPAPRRMVFLRGAPAEVPIGRLRGVVLRDLTFRTGVHPYVCIS